MGIQEFVNKLDEWMRDPIGFLSERKTSRLKQWQKNMIKFVIENRRVPRGMGKSKLWLEYNVILITACNYMEY